MKNSSFRIRTTPGEDSNININLDQKFDVLEILSLKIRQEDLYDSFCADYGVIVGRIIANDGFGVPNAKVSVFIPISNEDEQNELIKKVYPYKTVNSLNDDGVRYNLLLEESTCSLSVPVGTFPSKKRVLSDDVVLEVYDKYYKYTTTTNDAGDYIIFGVPTGQHTIHMDVDLSDIGFLSVRPYDLKAQGYPDNLFDGKEFRVSKNLDELPQIRTQNKSVDVVPFWGDDEICSVGICRVDFNIGNDLGANAIFMGSIFTDSDDNYLNFGCGIKKRMGEQGQLVTGPGQVDIIKAVRDANNNKPTSLEYLQSREIDEDGVFVITLPMYYDRIVTDEFGNIVESQDQTKGIPTKGDYRFKLKFNDATTVDGNKQITTASLIVPSINSQYFITSLKCDYGRFTIEDDYLIDLQDVSNNLFDYEFQVFEWKQVYTTSQYIAKSNKRNGRFRFIGLKDCGRYVIPDTDDGDTDDGEDDTSVSRVNIPFNTAIDRNVPFNKYKKFKLCFFDAWLNGGNYMFKFRTKRTTLGGYEFCGIGGYKDFSRDFDCRCRQINNEYNKVIYNCTVMSPNFGIVNKSTGVELDVPNGANDTNEFIYCNSTLSTKIINIGSMAMCGEILEKLKNQSYLKKYEQKKSGLLRIGTGGEEGIRTEILTETTLSPTTYRDPTDNMNLLPDVKGLGKKDAFKGNVWQTNSCYDKQANHSKLVYNTITLGLQNVCRLDYDGEQIITDLKNWVSPQSYSTDQTTNKTSLKINSPYFYFGLNPGKTALDKLRRDYF